MSFYPRSATIMALTDGEALLWQQVDLGADHRQVMQQLINQARIHRFLRQPVGSGLLRVSVQSALEQGRQIRNSPELASYYSVDAA